MSTTQSAIGDGTPFGPDEDASESEHLYWELIDEIPDPHIPVSLVEMGMIYDVSVDGGEVTVEMTFPCMGCPAYDMIQGDIEGILTVEESVDSVEIDVVWDPVWSKEMLTPAVREKMRESGISL
ncbi:MAG TPA: metal-sulfur cluster assembly factor [Halococcus sp.]|nr:metal-sulfur cluster assembly factor [Halococcus sp.]